MTAMTAKAILDEIQPLGRDSYKKVLLNHGVTEPCFGVTVEELKKIQERVKKDYRLSASRRSAERRGAGALIRVEVRAYT